MYPTASGFYWFRYHSPDAMPYEWEIVSVSMEKHGCVIHFIGTEQTDFCRDLAELQALGEWGPAVPAYTPADPSSTVDTDPQALGSYSRHVEGN